jgi:hypothetical protein
MTDAIEKVWVWVNKCTCQRCNYSWKTFITPKKCPKCFDCNWVYKSGGPVENEDRPDGRKLRFQKGGEPGDVLPGPTT